MDEACSTCEGVESWIRGMVGSLRESDHLEDLGIDRRIILKWKFKK